MATSGGERERGRKWTRKRKYTYTQFDKCNKIKYQDIMARETMETTQLLLATAAPAAAVEKK